MTGGQFPKITDAIPKTNFKWIIDDVDSNNEATPLRTGKSVVLGNKWYRWEISRFEFRQWSANYEYIPSISWNEITHLDVFEEVIRKPLWSYKCQNEGKKRMVYSIKILLDYSCKSVYPDIFLENKIWK